MNPNVTLTLILTLTNPRQNVVVYARMLTYNDEEPWPQNLGAVAITNYTVII